MNITIPIPTLEQLEAIAAILALMWTIFQEYRHKVKHGENVSFIKKKSILKDAEKGAS